MRKRDYSLKWFTAVFGVGLATLVGAQVTQVPSAGTGVIWGRVVDAEAAPVDDAVVALLRGGRVSSPVFDRVRTNSGGYFLFNKVPPGQWTLTAGKEGYRSTSASGRPVSIDLGDGQRSAELKLEIQRRGSIEGRVEDEFGDGMAALRVRLFARRSHGRWIPGPTTQSDDQGNFRFSGVAPGVYVAVLESTLTSRLRDNPTAPKPASGSASPSAPGFAWSRSTIVLQSDALAPRPLGDGQLTLYPTTFALSARSLVSAEQIVVTSGDARVGVLIRPGTVAAFRVSGTVVAMDGLNVGGDSLRLVFADLDGSTTEWVVASTTIGPMGQFEFPAVPSGRYRINFSKTIVPSARQASEVAASSETIPIQTRLLPQPVQRASTTFWAATPVVVQDEHVDNLTVELRHGVRVNGRIQIDRASAPSLSALNQGPIQLVPADGRQSPFLPAKFDQNLTFETPELPPGSYIFWYNPPAPWRMASAVVQGRDISDLPLELGQSPIADVIITLTNQAPSIVGVVRDGATALPGASVVLFPIDQKLWQVPVSRRVRLTQSSAGGKYSLPLVPAGDYFLAALDRDPGEGWEDPQILARLAAIATRIAARAGQVSQDLAVARFQSKLADATLPGQDVFYSTEPAGRFVSGPMVAESTPNESAPQSTARAPAALSGQVVTVESPSQPIRGATVLVTNATTGHSLATITDGGGRFAVGIESPGYYRIEARKAGFISSEFGAKGPGRPGTSVAIKSGEPESIVLTMFRGAIISGTVTGPTGVPMPGASVRVMSQRPGPAGVLVPAKGATPLEAIADYRGRYRIYGLLPGKYFVGATSGNTSAGTPARQTPDDIPFAGSTGASASSTINISSRRRASDENTFAFVSAWYPGVQAWEQAASLTLQAGEERNSIDISLQRIPTSTLVGSLVLSSGGPPGKSQVTLIPTGPYVPTSFALIGAPGSGDAMSRGGATDVTPNAAGRFFIRGLAPGRYTVIARGTSDTAGSTTEWAVQQAEVGQGDADISVRLHLPLEIRGRASFSGLASGTPASAISVRLESVEPQALVPVATPALVQADGLFRIQHVFPGRYRLVQVGANSDWYAVSTTQGDAISLDNLVTVVDADKPVELSVQFTRTPSELSGKFEETSGQPAVDYFVVVFPSEERYWSAEFRRSQAVRPNRDGTFRFVNLPSGEYLLAALTDLVPEELQDPSFLQALMKGAVAVTVRAGQHSRQDLRVGR